MAIINGEEFINRLNQLENEIWLSGQQVTGKLSQHPAFNGILRSKASLYDLQNDPAVREGMTFRILETDERIGLSFLQPKTVQDLKRRRKMIACWAKQTHGLMGRSPDYMNTAIMSFAASKRQLEGKKNCFPENLESLYQRACKEDLSFTHSFIAPQVNRSQTYLGKSEKPISAKIVDRNEQGIVITGARLLATQGGLTDEILVISTPRLVIDSNEAFGFSIPSNSKGLKFICRESFVGGESSFDYPLSSSYDEMDSVVVFDHVLVPWNRVFFYDIPEVATDFMNQSSFQTFAYHQVVTRQIAKTEFVLGIAELLIETIRVSEYPHIQEKMTEMIVGLETLKALVEKSENDAKLDEWGFMRPSRVPLQVASNIFPKIYPRFCEIIQLIGASGMISLPTEIDFASPYLRPDLDQYLQATNKSAFDRVKLFRLAWDMTMSSFGTRQIQYERYFFGDPVRLASALYHHYPTEDLVADVNQFLGFGNEPY